MAKRTEPRRTKKDSNMGKDEQLRKALAEMREKAERARGNAPVKK